MALVNFEKKNSVGIITIDRPEAMNSLNADVLNELSAVVDKADADQEVKCIVVTGAGRAFVAGADIANMQSLDEEEGFEFGRLGQEVFRKIETLKKPVIAAVNGFALGGGCELAMACDIRLAGEKAKFGQPEVGLGITPGYSGTQRLPRLVGKGKAMELIFTGEIISADEACKIGLVNKVVGQDELMDQALAMAEKISANAPLAVSFSKQAITEGMETADMDEAIMIEAKLFGKCFATEDQKEGMSAFLEKRPALYKGK